MSARKYWLGFHVINGIGPVRLQGLARHFGDLELAWRASESDLLAAGLDRRSLANVLLARQSINLDKLAAEVEATGASVLTLDDSDYPALLREIPDAPPVLYFKGTLVEADRWAVAFVGTRRATVYGRDVTQDLVAGLVNAGITIVSGLALGIDAAAHRAALDSGGRTIAVMGCGIDTIYPPEHRHLAEEIMEHGAVVTEFPPGTPPEGKNFPVRNRIISGFSLGVVVVEAPASSGALLTADVAADQGRDVFAVPGNITSKNSTGANRLIQQGAKLVMRVEDIMDELNLTAVTVETRTKMREIAPVDATEAAVIKFLGTEPLHIDEICRLSGLPIVQLSSTLSLMELKGLVRRVEGMQYTLTRGSGALYRLD
ncbi:MAG TPA: DNA-processing protein DprA [Aggregatilineaceae bacterium]|nr:DNA-processing protein DprA [Aggregatilineaceae bacterium]